MGFRLTGGGGGSASSLTGSTSDLTTADAYIGKGTSDTDIIFIALRNTNGDQVFIYPNSTKNGVVVKDTRP
jgi:hypothetical protein